MSVALFTPYVFLHHCTCLNKIRYVGMGTPCMDSRHLKACTSSSGNELTFPLLIL
jgi:hypothetical protein